jgi:hypothetical protein
MLGINSPSRVFSEIGGHLMDGLSQGIERAAGEPLAAMRGVAAGLAVPIAAGGLMLGTNSAFAVPQTATIRPIMQMPQPVMTQPIMQMPQPEQATSPIAAPAPIHITVNLNGPSSPEAANDIAAAVRREVERALAESARRDALARRAAMIDGGLA